jgi:uncharacterized protein YabE (DUF348 family)
VTANLRKSNAENDELKIRPLSVSVDWGTLAAVAYAAAVHKTVTLLVDGSPMTVSTMKSRVVDVLRDNGFAVGGHDGLVRPLISRFTSPTPSFLRRARPLQMSVDGQQSRQVWTTALTVDGALKQLSMSDAAPAAASRGCRLSTVSKPADGF